MSNVSVAPKCGQCAWCTGDREPKPRGHELTCPHGYGCCQNCAHCLRGHTATITRFVLGKTPIRPPRPVYGTVVRCGCGWRYQVNRAPSKGGRQEALRAHREHKDAL